MHFRSLLGLLSTTSLFCNVAYALSHIAPNDLAAQYKLSTSTVLPFPSTTQATKDAQNLILDKWSLGKGRIQDGADNLAFVNDPFPGSKPAGTQDTDSSTSGPVLQVKYPGNNTGGSQFYTLWNTTDGSKFNTMLLSYEVAIENAFDWGKGGKLPGLRGGLVSHGCSGSEKSDGKECFSARLGWRKDGDGEVTAYIPTTNNICSDPYVSCANDTVVALHRGDFTFVAGQWMRMSLLIQLNNPPNIANGEIAVYFNDLLAGTQQNLQIRTTDNLASNGLYFSTFFNNQPTQESHIYFREIRLWGGASGSNISGGANVGTGSGSTGTPGFTLSSTTLTITVLLYVALSSFTLPMLWE